MAKKGDVAPAVGTRKKRRKKRIVIAIVAVAVVAIAGFVLWRIFGNSGNAAVETAVSTGVVMRGEVSNEMTSSGTLQPKDTYTITSLVSGEIISADFEEGDQVEEGQVLYVIDQSDITQQLENAQRSLTEAENTYNKAIEELGGGTIKSTQTGYIQSISIHEGDTTNGQQIATLYNDDAMTLRVAFLNTDADMLSVGQDVIVVLSDTAEQIPGRITQKSDELQTIDSGVVVKYIEVTVTNPGGLTTTDRATVTAGGINSVSDGTFEAYTSDVQLSVELPAEVKIASVLVGEGDYVTNGTALFTITQDSYNDAVTAAEDSLINAQNEFTNAQESVDDYTITAPISGQVITKTAKAGDNITGTTGSLALIYDLSELTFEMSIDELDISDIEVGQEVEVTADAFEGEIYSGYVSNVSLAGSYQNGVTTYPVVVTIEDTGDLLPGMNVDGTIILERSEDTLYVPASALQRGNVVYVQNDSLTETQSSVGSSEVSGDDEGVRSAPAGDLPGGEAPQGMPEEATMGEASQSMVSPGEFSEETSSGGNALGGASGGDKGTETSQTAVENIETGEEGSMPESTEAAENTESLESAENTENQETGEVTGLGNSDESGFSSDDAQAMLAGRDVPEGFTAVQVETGIISNDYVEILSGLSEGQIVYLSDTASTDDSYFMGGGDFGMGGGMGGGDRGGGGGPGGGGGF